MTAPDVRVRVFGITDVGRTREHNEDAFLVADLESAQPMVFPEEKVYVPGARGALFMVADGMGGAAAGEIASSMAVEVILGELKRNWSGGPGGDPNLFAVTLHDATEVANDRIHEYASDHPENRGMGTTATVAGILGDTLYIAQVGDSRAYLVRSGTARQITKDQSLMQRLIEAGEITAEEAEVSERRNIILQALGPEASIKVDVTHQPVRQGDILVLCSDGLSGVVRDNEIAKTVREAPNLVTLCRTLIDLANASGGPDNITVVAARFEGDGLSPPSDDDEVGHRAFQVGENTPVTPHPKFDLADPGVSITGSRRILARFGAARARAANAGDPDANAGGPAANAGGPAGNAGGPGTNAGDPAGKAGGAGGPAGKSGVQGLPGVTGASDGIAAPGPGQVASGGGAGGGVSAGGVGGVGGAGGAGGVAPTTPAGRKRRTAVLVIAVAALAALVAGLVAYLRAR